MRTLNTLLKGGLTAKLATAPFSRAAPASRRAPCSSTTPTAGVIGPAAQAAGLTLRRIATAPARLEDVDRSPRIAVFTNAVDQSVWSLRNLGFTADPVGTTALSGASDPLVSYDVIFSTANYPANTPATPPRGRGWRRSSPPAAATSAAARPARRSSRTAASRRGSPPATRGGNGRSGIVFWDNTGGAASPITGAYPSRDTAIVDPPTWFTAVPAGWSIDANLPIAGFFAAGLWLIDAASASAPGRADGRARHEHDGRIAPAGRVRVQPALPRRPGARVARPRLGRVLGGRRIGIDANEYTRRRERLGELLARRGLDALFVPPGSDLEYLTGIERDLPTFGQISYAHGWVTGAFLAPGQEPVYVLPRMVVAFHLDGVAPPRARSSSREDGNGRESFAEAVGEIGSPRRIALGQRVWAETVIELLAAVPGRSSRRARRSSTSCGA